MRKLLVIVALVMTLMLINVGCKSTEEVEKSNEVSEKVEEVKSEETPDLQEEPLKFSMCIRSSGYFSEMDKPMEDPFILAMNKKFDMDINIRFLNKAKQREEMQLMFASGEIPDVVVYYDRYSAVAMAGSVEAGLYMPLNDLLAQNSHELPNLMASIPEISLEMSKLPQDGKIYGLPGRYLSETSRRGVFMRKDLLDKFGLEVPKTIDEYVHVMRVFKENGVPYPYAGRKNFAYTGAFFGAFGAFPSTWGQDSEGKIVPDMIRPEMKEALAFHAMLNKEGLMDPESMTNSGSDWGNKISSGKVGIWTHNAQLLPTWNVRIKENVPDAEVILVPAPVGPNGHSGMYNYSPVYQSLYINKNFKEPVRLLKVLDHMASDDGQQFFAYGLEGVHHTVNANGEVEFQYPENSTKLTSLKAMSNLNLVGDAAYDKYTIESLLKGDELLHWFQNIAPQEGYNHYDVGRPKSLENHMDLFPTRNPKFKEVAASIFLGNASPDAHDDFVQEYYEDGGDKVIEEVNRLNDEGKIFLLE